MAALAPTTRPKGTMLPVHPHTRGLPQVGDVYLLADGSRMVVVGLHVDAKHKINEGWVWVKQTSGKGSKQMRLTGAPSTPSFFLAATRGLALAEHQRVVQILREFLPIKLPFVSA